MTPTQRALPAAAILIATVLTACARGGGAPRNQGPPPLAVDVARAQRQDIATYVALDGQIAPLQESTLSSPQSGNVAAVYVTEGQRVGAGQAIAKIDDSTLRASLAQQQAIVQQQTAALGSSTLQLPVTAANASNTIVTAQQQLAAARNNVQTALASYQSAKSTYDADMQLLAQGYVARTATDVARAQYVAAQQAYNNAQQSQKQAEAALRAAQQQSSNAVPIQSQQVSVNRAQLAAAQAQVRLLETQIAQTSIVAPFAGVVTQRMLDPGSFASPNQPVVRVSQIDTVYLNVNVPDEDLPYVHSGTPVTFTTSSVGNRSYRGAVLDVNATPTSGTLSYRARIRVPNPENRLRGGMLVSVNVRKEYHPNAIVVPRTAVFQTENGANLFTVIPPPSPAPGSPAAAGGAGAGAAGGGAAPAGGAAGGGRRRHGAGGGAGGPGGPGGGSPFGAPARIMQARVVPVNLGLQTDTLAEVISPEIRPGTTVITTRPDALQDKSLVAIAAPAPGGRRGAQ